MKITVAQWDLSEALQKLQSIVPPRTPTPILQNVLLEANDNGLQCTTTNGEISTKILVEGLVEEPGAITVNCRKLASLTKNLGEDQVELKTTSNDRLQVLSGKGRYTFGGLSADQFFDMPSGSEVDFTIPAGNLRACLQDTDFACSTEEVRYVLNGVSLKFYEDKIEFAACDGKQFAVAKYETKSNEELEQIVVPLRSCAEIKKVFTEDEDINVYIEDSYIVFATNTYQLSTRKIDLSSNQFPDYWKYIDFEDNTTVFVNKEQLEKSIYRISLFAKDDNCGIDLDINDTENTLEVTAENEGYDGHEAVDISDKTSVFGFRINSSYLKSILGHLDCEDVMVTLSPDKSRVNMRCQGNENQRYTVALLMRGEE